MPKLNLGAGTEKRTGFINHDVRKHSPHIHVVHDLNMLPWPWEDGQFDLVRSWAVFEHLTLTLAESMGECWRILKPGGTLVIKVPRFCAKTVPHDPTHRWMGWEPETFQFFDPARGRYGKRGAMYGLPPWKLLSCRLMVEGRAVSATLQKVDQ